MGAGETKYETKTVKALRGVEGRTVDKWQAQGWEVVSRSPGKVQTEITLRRPVRSANTKLYVVGGAVVALTLAIVVAFSALTHRSTSAVQSEPQQSSSSPVSPSASSASTSATSVSAKAQSGISQAGTRALTVANSPELATILSDHENCSDTIDAFARKHVGETIAFDGNIASLERHGDTSTRYDVMVGAGNYSTSTAAGPSFQFHDVNPAYDLHFTGADPGVIEVGDNVHVVATVDKYVPASCLFFIEPVTTTRR